MLRLVVLYWTVQTMMRPLVAPYAYSLDTGTALAGVALAASAVPAALLCLPIGLYCDRLGYRGVVAVGAVASAASTAAMAAFQSPAVLLGSQVFFGIGQLAMWVAIQGLMITSGESDESRETRAKRVINYSSLGFVGQVAGPLLGGYLVDLWGYAVAFAVAAGLSVLSLAGIAAVGRGRSGVAGSASVTSVSTRDVLASYRTGFDMLRARGVTLTMAVSFCALFLLDVRLGLQPVYFHSIGIGPSLIGWILVTGTIASVVSRVFLVLVIGKLRDGTLIALSLGLSGVTVFATVLTTSLPLILVLSALSGAALGMVQPLTIILTADYSPPGGKGMGIGLRMLANRGAQGANPVMLSALTPLVGLTAAIGAISLLGGLAGLLSGRRLNRLPPG
jgi:MFS family permease